MDLNLFAHNYLDAVQLTVSGQLGQYPDDDRHHIVSVTYRTDEAYVTLEDKTYEALMQAVQALSELRGLGIRQVWAIDTDPVL